MPNLITLTDIKTLKPLSKNADASKTVDPFVFEAQEFELRPFMSDEFYLDLLDDFNNGLSPNFVKYNDLWNGHTWIKNNTKYENPGLKKVLIYYSYARIINRAPTAVTAYGVRSKKTADSEPVTEKTISRLVGQATSGARAYEERVRFFLDCNSKDFPLWDCGEDNKKAVGFRISGAGGNSNSNKVWDPVSRRFIFR